MEHIEDMHEIARAEGEGMAPLPDDIPGDIRNSFDEAEMDDPAGEGADGQL